MSILRHFLLFLAQKRTSNYNLVDLYILLFKKVGWKGVTTLHRRKNLLRVDMTFFILINYFRKLILYFLFTIPHKVSSFQGFCLLLWTANLRNNSLLVKIISIACMIPCQILIVPNLIFIGVALGRDLREIAALNLFTKPERW